MPGILIGCLIVAILTATHKKQALQARLSKPKFHSLYFSNSSGEQLEDVQGPDKRRSSGLVNFVPALDYHFYLTLPVAFAQPGNHLLAAPHMLSPYCNFIRTCGGWKTEAYPSPSITHSCARLVTEAPFVAAVQLQGASPPPPTTALPLL